MTISFIRIFILWLCLLLLQYKSYGQGAPSIRWEPGFSVTKKLNSRWSINASLSGRQRFTDYGRSETNFKTDRWELKSFGTYTLLGGKKLSAGYMYRTTDPFESESGYEHRITQQIAFLSYIGAFRLSNKFRVEQRIRSTAYQTRFRYGISNDFPLQGEKIDPNEFYLIVGNELVYALATQFQELENRFSLGIGRLIGVQQKFQFSVASRFSDLLSNQRDHIIQLETVYFFNL